MSHQELTPLGADMAQLLRASNDLPGPSAHVEERLYTRIAVSVAAGAGAAGLDTAAASGSSAGPTAAAAATTGLGVKAVTVAVALAAVVGLGGIAVYLAFSTKSAPDTDSVPAQIATPTAIPTTIAAPIPTPRTIATPIATPTAATTAALPVTVQPVPSEAAAAKHPSAITKPLTRSRARPKIRPARPVVAMESLAEEQKLVDASRAASARGDSALALEKLREHGRRFARGRLAEERDASWIHVLVRAGRIDQARQRATRFQRSYPKSLYRRSVIRAVEQVLVTE